MCGINLGYSNSDASTFYYIDISTFNVFIVLTTIVSFLNFIARDEIDFRIQVLFCFV